MPFDPNWMPAVIGLCGALVVAFLTVGSNALLALDSRRFSADHAWEEKQLEARRLAYGKVLTLVWRAHHFAHSISISSPQYREMDDRYYETEDGLQEAIGENLLLISTAFQGRISQVNEDLHKLLIEQLKRSLSDAAPTGDHARKEIWTLRARLFNQALVDLKNIAQDDLAPPHRRPRSGAAQAK